MDIEKYRNDNIKVNKKWIKRSNKLLNEYKKIHPNANLHFVNGIGWCI